MNAQLQNALKWQSKKFKDDGQHDLAGDELYPLSRLEIVDGNRCRWPYGDDGKCCGRETPFRKSYCEVHAKKARGKESGKSYDVASAEASLKKRMEKKQLVVVKTTASILDEIG